jgi:hypothetical protein
MTSPAAAQGAQECHWTYLSLFIAALRSSNLVARMELSSVVSAIGRMPTEFHSRVDVSMMQLLIDSGYLSNQSLVTIDLLSTYFAEHPEAVDAWLRQSWDNRGSPSWYLQDPQSENSQGMWVVGFYPGDHREYFERGAEACAVFVKNRLIQMSGQRQ